MDAALPNPGFLASETSLAGPVLLWPALRRYVRRLALSASQRSLVDFATRASDAIGQRLLESADVDDLEGAIEDTLEEGTLWSVVAEMCELLSKLPRDELVSRLQESSSDSWEPTLVIRVFGEQGVKALARADEIGAELAGSMHLLPLNAFVDAARQVKDVADPLSFLHDRSVPSPVARLLLELLKGQPLAFGVMQALIRGEHLEPWLSHAVLSRWLRALAISRQFFRLIATSAGVGPQDAEALQWATEVGAFQAKVDAGYAELLKRGRESGVDVFPSE